MLTWSLGGGTFFGFSPSSFPVSLRRGALGSVGIRVGECPPALLPESLPRWRCAHTL